ncbi:RNA polymerase I specific transcriptioninitiation factor RRN3 protein [Striga asiatica]|uniref:RNA polymerase I specific transcriptioninitiation factor RRN3 protein n=1 Tax=Striga asiatica TaxID=4170 RepID=A0A5A7PJG6_STRAF|nr:RNA polymerase I specific transcriptioninitiation factor RRN3 protein [Striga asiatica]
MGAPDMAELNFTDSELPSRVRNALRAAVKGDSDFYNQLVAVIHHKERLAADEVALLLACLKAVRGAVSCIDIVHHRALLAAIFGMSLWNYGNDVMDALVGLLVSLASSSGEYVDLCLDMLVVNFVPPFTSPSATYFLELLKKPHGLAKKSQVLDRVHSTLKDIANVVPLSPVRLEKIVRDRMPNIYAKEPTQLLCLNERKLLRLWFSTMMQGAHRLPFFVYAKAFRKIHQDKTPFADAIKRHIVMYVENMLRLEGGVMGELIGSTILVALVDRLIELDVEIAWDDILQEDFHKGIFDMELEDLNGNADDIEQDSNELTREALIQRFFSGNLVAEKLDSLMVLTFEHIKSCFESGRLAQVFEILLQSFQKTVLTAYKAKFTQFVMFYACSLDPENCGKMFLNMLLDIFVSSLNPEWRMGAVAYLASYLARAKFVPVSFVADMLESVVNWCFLYCKNQDGDINPKAHKVFYAGCQAIMYVLCFRMRQIVAIPRLKSQLLLMRIEDVIRHPLRPLQVCLPSIVEEFLRLVKANGVFSLPQSSVNFGLLESENSMAFGGIKRLDMFFPFDPCLLKKCDSYIRPNYVYWSMVRSSYDDDDDGEGMSYEDEDEDEDVAVAYEGDGMSIPDNGSRRSYDEENSDADEFEYSLDKMSITPRDSSSKFGGGQQRFMQMPSKIRPSMSPESY